MTVSTAAHRGWSLGVCWAPYAAIALVLLQQIASGAKPQVIQVSNLLVKGPRRYGRKSTGWVRSCMAGLLALMCTILRVHAFAKDKMKKLCFAGSINKGLCPARHTASECVRMEGLSGQQCI